MGELTLRLVDDEVVDTPAALLVEVGNGADGETVTFSIDGDDLIEGVLDDEDGTLEISVPLPELTADAYTLDVVGTTSTIASADFTVLEAPLDDAEDTNELQAPEAPTFTPDVHHRWQFIDTTVGHAETYTMVRNPAKWSNPNRPLYLEHDVTTAPDGNILAWEGAERSWSFEFSGFFDTQAEYEALQHWSEKRRRFWLIDHREKVRYITFEQFDARARIVPNKPWAHDYTIRAVHFFRQNWDGEA